MANALNIVNNITPKSIAQLIAITVIYFIAGKLALLLAFVNPSTTAVWPPTGIALTVLLLGGYRFIPAIFIGAFFVNVTTAGDPVTSLVIALGNTLEGLVGAWFVNRFAGGSLAFEKTQHIIRFTLLAGIASTMISATIGTSILFFAQYLPLNNFGETWITWWLGDLGGALIIAPLLILLFTKRTFLLGKIKIVEALLLLLVVFLVSELVFGGFFPSPYTLPYLCITILMWIALYRTQTEAAIGIFLVYIIATYHTLNRTGPFVEEGLSTNHSLILLQMFLGITSIMTHIVSSIVTEQKKIRQIRERLATIVNSSTDAIYSMNLQGTITTWNKGAVKIFGYTAREMVGQSATKIAPNKKNNELQEIVSTVKKGKHILPYETERKRKDGKLIPVSISISPLKDINGTIIEISKIARDISREKELDKRKDEFISMASHELNTPITGLSIYVQTLTKLLEKRGDKETIEYLTKMHSQIQRIRFIVRDLLDISKIRLGVLTFTYSKFSITLLVKESVEAVQYISRKHKIILKGRTRHMVMGDRDRIAQVLTNLLSNARKYSPTGEKIIVRISSHKNEVIVSVQDFGIGIAKKHQKKVFELFYRIEEYHGKTFPGMGIGLYLSFQIIDEHKGRMWFESKRGKGTTFYFSLPIQRSE